MRQAPAEDAICISCLRIFRCLVLQSALFSQGSTRSIGDNDAYR